MIVCADCVCFTITFFFSYMFGVSVVSFMYGLQTSQSQGLLFCQALEEQHPGLQSSPLDNESIQNMIMVKVLLVHLLFIHFYFIEVVI